LRIPSLPLEQPYAQAEAARQLQALSLVCQRQRALDPLQRRLEIAAPGIYPRDMVVQPYQPIDRGVGLLLDQRQRSLVVLQRGVVLADQRLNHAKALVQLNQGLRAED